MKRKEKKSVLLSSLLVLNHLVVELGSSRMENCCHGLHYFEVSHLLLPIGLSFFVLLE